MNLERECKLKCELVREYDVWHSQPQSIVQVLRIVYPTSRCMIKLSRVPENVPLTSEETR